MVAPPQGLSGSLAASGSSIIPSATSTYDLGAGGTLWNNLYVVHVKASTDLLIGGTGGLTSGTIFQLTQSGNSAQAMFDSYGTSVNSYLIGRRARGTSGSPTALSTDDIMFLLSGRGYGSTAMAAADRASIALRASQVWTDANQGTYIDFQTTANGGTSTTSNFRIHPDGAIAFNSGKKLFIDGATGAGDTYLIESSVNNFSVVTGGTENFRVSATGLGVISGSKIFLDGVGQAGDTYLYEETANQISLLAGGVKALTVNTSNVQAKAFQKAGDPTSSDVAAGFFNVTKNTSSGEVRLWYNDSGTMKSVVLA